MARIELLVHFPFLKFAGPKNPSENCPYPIGIPKGENGKMIKIVKSEIVKRYL
jgi:hypothetical protein